MKRFICFFTVLFIIVIPGCEWIEYLTDPIFFGADEIAPADLASYDPSLYLPTTREEVALTLFGLDLNSTARVLLETEGGSRCAAELYNAVPGLDIILGQADFSGNPPATSRSAEAGGFVQVQDEIFDLYDNTILTVDNARMEVQGGVNQLERPTESNVSFDASLSFSIVDPNPGAYIPELITNAVAKGDIEVTLGYTTDTYTDYYGETYTEEYLSSITGFYSLKSDANIGVTINDEYNGLGGKYIISVMLWTDKSFAYSETDETAPDWEEQLSDLQVGVTVYDNYNNYVGDYTYTVEELVGDIFWFEPPLEVVVPTPEPPIPTPTLPPAPPTPPPPTPTP